MDLFAYLMSKKKNKLPSGYTEVDYIQTSGEQYIITNYTPVRYDEIEIKNVKYTYTTSSDTRPLFIAGSSDPLFTFISASRDYIHYYKYFNSGGARSFGADLVSGFNTIKLNSTGVYINGAFKDGNNAYVGDVNTPLRFFARVDLSGSKYLGTMGRATITNNSVVKLDLVPCYRNSDNEVGLYDLVNDVFYTNQGTGAFLSGPEVKNPPSRNIAKYILLEDN